MDQHRIKIQRWQVAVPRKDHRNLGAGAKGRRSSALRLRTSFSSESRAASGVIAPLNILFKDESIKKGTR